MDISHYDSSDIFHLHQHSSVRPGGDKPLAGVFAFESKLPRCGVQLDLRMAAGNLTVVAGFVDVDPPDRRWRRERKIVAVDVVQNGNTGEPIQQDARDYEGRKHRIVF